MKIFVKIKPRSRIQRIEKLNEDHYTVSVKEPPIDGKANEAVGRVLAKYFSVPQSRIRLVAGHTGRQKIFEILS